ELRLGGADPFRLTVGKPFRNRAWYRVWASYDAASGSLSVGQAPVDGTFATDQDGTASMIAAESLALDSGGPLTIAARGTNRGPASMSHHFNGKIEAPSLYGRSLAPEERDRVWHGEDQADLVARWDFAREISSTRFYDAGAKGLDGELVNLPARAMIGSTWSGRETCWRHAPEEYAAIHFHDDDVYDFGWDTDFSFQVPADLPSGVYAARLSCGDHQDNVPFIVCPPRGTRSADLCVIIPTFTYVIYGNHARAEFGDAWRSRAAEWNAYPWNPAEHTEYGLSTYNFHSDGSGICHASHQRPLVTLKQGFLTFAEPEGRSGLRHYQADCHIVAWLQAK
ncbi:MAG: hypothetical protein MI867_10630, partial [Pseudomonadales bacterium]|nr:hypothetical protein [Pseudomonadales bacterium]